MRPRALTATILALIGAFCLAACGSSDGGAIPQGDADEMLNSLRQVEERTAEGNCDGARESVGYALSVADGIEDEQTKQGVEELLERLETLINQECEEVEEPATTDSIPTDTTTDPIPTTTETETTTTETETETDEADDDGPSGGGNDGGDTGGSGNNGVGGGGDGDDGGGSNGVGPGGQGPPGQDDGSGGTGPGGGD